MPHVATEPNVIKLIERLRVEIENAVSAFPRKHRYATGQRLRDEIATAGRLANRAWRDERCNTAHWTQQLVWAIDEFKATLRVAAELRAFTSGKQFHLLIVLAEDLGRQAGGWWREHRAVHPNGQNGPGRSAQGQRAQTLSTPAASARGHA